LNKKITNKQTNKNMNEFKKQTHEYKTGIVYGIVYGMGAPSLGAQLKVSIGEAQKFIDSFLGKVKKENKHE